jgi:hypothetical protein
MFLPIPPRLRLADYQALVENAVILEADSHGAKVLQLTDGSFLKLFRLKRLFSSALLLPPVLRLTRHLAELQALDIPCPTLIRAFRVREIQRDGAHYHPLVGHTLRHLIADHQDMPGSPDRRLALGHFVARLHTLGVYFRSLHLGNIIETTSGALGLIDVADMRFLRGALGAARIRRNFRHLLRIPEDRAWLLADGGEVFSRAYSDRRPGFHPKRIQAWLLT